MLPRAVRGISKLQPSDRGPRGVRGLPTISARNKQAPVLVRVHGPEPLQLLDVLLQDGVDVGADAQHLHRLRHGHHGPDVKVRGRGDVLDLVGGHVGVLVVNSLEITLCGSRSASPKDCPLPLPPVSQRSAHKAQVCTAASRAHSPDIIIISNDNSVPSPLKPRLRPSKRGRDIIVSSCLTRGGRQFEVLMSDRVDCQWIDEEELRQNSQDDLVNDWYALCEPKRARQGGNAAISSTVNDPQANPSPSSPTPSDASDTKTPPIPSSPILTPPILTLPVPTPPLNHRFDRKPSLAQVFDNPYRVDNVWRYFQEAREN